MSVRFYNAYWRTNSLKAEKCEFHVSSVQFLGFIIEEGQLRKDPEKVKAVTEWPVPSSRRQLQQFLGFANFYRRFIRDYSRLANPLTQLDSPKVEYTWTPEADRAFHTLKERFASAPAPTRPISLSLRWPPLTPESEPFYPSGLGPTRSSIPVRFSHVGSPLHRGTTTLATENCWLSNWPWRSGGIGWRELYTPSSFGLTTGTWSISTQPDASTLARLAGPYSCFAMGSRLSGHPGIHRTITWLRHAFWWPSLEEDTRVPPTD